MRFEQFLQQLLEKKTNKEISVCHLTKFFFYFSVITQNKDI